MLSSPARAVAVISYHASPLGDLGRGENGGMNLAIRRLCEGLSERGVPTDVFVRREDLLAPDEELIAPRSRLIRISAGPVERLSKSDAADHVEEFARAVIAHALDERRCYRLIHAHYWLGGLVARDLSAVWRCPWVQSFHTLALSKQEAGLEPEPGRAAAERELAKAADRLLASSRSEVADLQRLYGAPPGEVRLVHPGVDVASNPSVDEIARLRGRLGLEGRRVLLFAARLEPLKGPELALRTLAVLGCDPTFDDVSLLIVGDDSGDGGKPSIGERARLQALAAELGLSDRARFTGSVDHADMPAHYALAEACLVPSRTETFGLVALEAQAMGTPVVASRVGGLVEVVEDGVTGLLVTEREPALHAAAVRRVLTEAGLRARMGEAARSRARRFTWDASVAQLDSVYNTLTPPPQPALVSLTR